MPAIADPLIASELVDCRRFCGYPAYGVGVSDGLPWRFFPSYQTFEYRLENLTGPELVTVRNYLNALTTLEAAILTAASNLDTLSAGPFVQNPDEIKARTALFEAWSGRLINFIGAGPGPMFGNGSTMMLVR